MIGSLLIGGIIMFFSFLADPNKTIDLFAKALFARGFAMIISKVVEPEHKRASEIINFTGWCIAGVFAVDILAMAMSTVPRIGTFFGGATKKVEEAGNLFEKFGKLLDGLTFWE